MATSLVKMDLALSSDSGETLQSCGSTGKKKGRKKRKNKGSSQNVVASSMDDLIDEETSASKKKKITPNEDGSEVVSFDSDNEYEEAPEGVAIPRKRLYFPDALQMDFNSKAQWTFKLYKERPDFEVLFKDGKYREFVTVKDDTAVDFLTTEGFDNVILLKPSEEEKTTKVIVFGIPLCMEANLLLENSNIVKAARREVKSGGKVSPKPQLIAWLKGNVPEKIFVPCLGYKKVAVFEEQEPLCFKCSRWGHRAYKCQYETRCRYCSKAHDSRECVQKIKENVKITPKCCNCGEEHNANSRLCKKRPVASVIRPKDITKTSTGCSEKSIGEEASYNQGRSVVNVWEQRIQNSSNLERQNSDAIVALRIEVEQLKTLILTLQTTIDKVCSISGAPSIEKSVPDSVVKPAKGDSSMGRTEVDVHAHEESSQKAHYSNNGKHNVVNGRQFDQDIGSNCIQDMTNILDAVLTYMQAPDDELRNNVIAFAKRFKERVIKNGSV